MRLRFILALVAVALISSSANAQVGYSTRQSTTTDDTETTLKKILNALNGGAAASAYVEGSTAFEASHILKASPGTAISITGYSSKGSAQYILVFDSATVPSNGAIPRLPPVLVPPTSNFSIDVPITGCPFLTGITICNSSTAATKTIGTTDCWFTAVLR